MALPGMSAAAFLEGMPQRREACELLLGRVVLQREASLGDNMIKGEVFRAFKQAVEAAGSGHNVYPLGCVVQINDATVRAPDCIVQTVGAARARLVAAPLIVADVIFGEMTKGDLQQKLGDYFCVPSIQHFLVIDRARSLILHHWRADGDTLLTAIVRRGQIEFDGFAIATEAILEIAAT
jgi:Uma2 family endonuclease